MAAEYKKEVHRDLLEQEKIILCGLRISKYIELPEAGHLLFDWTKINISLDYCQRKKNRPKYQVTVAWIHIRVICKFEQSKNLLYLLPGPCGILVNFCRPLFPKVSVTGFQKFLHLVAHSKIPTSLTSNWQLLICYLCQAQITHRV